MTVRHRVSQTGEVEEALRSRTHDLGERVKELNCLYGISNLAQRPGISLQEMLQGTVDLIPPSWQYPEVTCARITLDGRECRTENFGETAWRQTSNIIVNGERSGAVEVCYLQEKPEADEGPFLKEERDLINAIAEELGRINDRKQAEEELRSHRDRLEEMVGERTAELTQANEHLRREAEERRQAEEGLRDSEERFRAIVENAPLGYYRVGNDGLWQYVNPVWERMHGYSAKDVIGKRFEITQTGEDVEAARQHVQRALTGETVTGEFSRATRQGTTGYHTFNIQPVRQGDKIVAIEGFINDITERKRAEEALRASEQRFSKAFHASPLAIVIATVSEGRIVDVNEGFLQLVGYSRKEVIGRTSLEIGIWVDSKGRERMVQEALKRGSVPNWELRVRTRSGETRVWLGAFVTIELDGVPCLLGMSRDITEHRQAEEALRESEKRLASIYDTAGDVIFLLDVEKDGGYRFTSVNHAFLSVTGLPAEAVVGKRVSDVIPEPSLTLVLGKYRQAVQKKAVVRWEETSDYPAGRLTGEVRVVAVFNEGGNCTHLVGTVHDITERKKTDDALRESERRFRQVLDVSADMIYKLDLESDTFDYISPSVLEMTGFTREEFIAMGPRGLRRRIHPEDWPDMRRGSEEFVELGSHPGFEYRLRCKDGEYRWLSDNRGLVRGEDGGPLALVGTVRDVTRRRRDEEALRESEERFRSLSAAAPIGIMLSDNKDGVISCNKRFLSIFGLLKEEAMGFGWSRSLHPDDRETFLAERSEAIAEGREFIREFRIVDPQGKTRWLSVHTTPLLSQGMSNTRMGTLADITERKEAEERDRKLDAERVRANELRRMVHILEQMAATLAHELRNPLGVISNSSYFLLGQADLQDEKARKHAEIISREVTSAKRVIDDILEFAHVPDLLLAPADINAIVNGTIARSQIPATVRVFQNLAPDLPPVVCDAERLERAFIDIITNAIQAMPQGGRLDAKTHPSADGVTVIFSDNGEGIVPENLPKVFEPMFTTKLRGLGLGLTVVRRTIEQHKGEVEIKSRRPRGTTVEITLPLR